MRHQLATIVFTLLAIGHLSQSLAQTNELKLGIKQPKITTVAFTRVRKSPQITAEEVTRLKLGTVLNVIASTSEQETIGGKTDRWYVVELPKGETGWVFGGVLLDYTTNERSQILRRIIEARLKAEALDFADRQQTYDLATVATNEAKGDTRGEFELLKLLALAGSAGAFPDNLENKSPYREWLNTHRAEVIRNEFAGGYNLRSELLWNLETKYHSLPIADRIAWEAAENPQPSDCEGDEVCSFFVIQDEIKYLSRHPNGSHTPEALKNLTEALSDDVIKTANEKGGDKYAVQQRTDLLKVLASLRLALAKTSAQGKDELLKKLDRIPGSRS